MEVTSLDGEWGFRRTNELENQVTKSDFKKFNIVESLALSATSKSRMLFKVMV
jgi:hypothetical protein